MMLADRTPFPANRLVEHRVRLDIWQLHRARALIPGAETAFTIGGRTGGYLRPIHPRQVLSSFAGVERVIGLLQDEDLPGVPRIWFECPSCRRRARHLYIPELQCRRCLRLEHRVRHAGRFGDSGRFGNLGSIAGARRRLNVDEQPFAPIPRPQRRRARYWRLAQQIAEQEDKLLRGVQRFVEAAEKGHLR